MKITPMIPPMIPPTIVPALFPTLFPPLSSLGLSVFTHTYTCIQHTGIRVHLIKY